MDTLQISRLLLSDTVCAPIFGGVHAADVFADIALSEKNLPQLYVVNTYNSHRPGLHWVAVRLEKKRAEFFDSYGLTPDLYSNIGESLRKLYSQVAYTDTQLQQPESDACGHYCTAYCLASARGYPLSDIVVYWNNQSDTVVKKFVEELNNYH